MKTIIKSVAFTATLLLAVSCKKDNASSKVNAENVQAAEKRDESLLSGPKVSFDREVHDFGTVNEGDIVETAFVVTNSGQTDLIITDAKASCGCTIPTWPKEPVKPGATAEIKVKFNTNGKKDKQSKTITLHTNTENGTETIKITGTVTPKAKG